MVVNTLASHLMQLEMSILLMLLSISLGKSFVNCSMGNQIQFSTDITKTNLYFLAFIKHESAEPGDCIQIGSGVARCNDLFAWPTEWTTGAVVGQTYTASVNVTSAKYNWKPGVYTMCFGDSDFLSSANDTYVGTVSFPALVSEPQNSIVISADYGAPMEVSLSISMIIR